MTAQFINTVIFMAIATGAMSHAVIVLVLLTFSALNVITKTIYTKDHALLDPAPLAHIKQILSLENVPPAH